MKITGFCPPCLKIDLDTFFQSPVKRLAVKIIFGLLTGAFAFWLGYTAKAAAGIAVGMSLTLHLVSLLRNHKPKGQSLSKEKPTVLFSQSLDDLRGIYYLRERTSLKISLNLENVEKLAKTVQAAMQGADPEQRIELKKIFYTGVKAYYFSPQNNALSRIYEFPPIIKFTEDWGFVDGPDKPITERITKILGELSVNFNAAAQYRTLPENVRWLPNRYETPFQLGDPRNLATNEKSRASNYINRNQFWFESSDPKVIPEG